MAYDLLSTKLRIPPPTHHVVPRARLVDALEDEIPRHKLILVSAPAGYGKTTLLADWARASSLPVAWLSIGEEDNDLERFFRYLLTAWESAQPGVSESSLGVLLGAMMPERDAVLTAFINVADDLPGQTVFVLDDYHLIEEASIHEALTFLLDHLPLSIHFVLARRGEPPLPLARYRARQELLEFDAENLQFQIDETEAFLNQQMALDLASDSVASLHAQLEGWIAGTQMVALTLRRHQLPVEHLVITGRHRFIADYLSQDVLAHLPGDLRQFLLRTCILDRLSGPLCDAVTGDENGQAMLETLERENLFLVSLDDNREWYRYHRLFADFLNEELKQRHADDVAHLHRQAAGWYFNHDLPEPAFQHAVAGDDPELVSRIFERYMSVKLNGGELKDLARWLDALPAAWYLIHPALGLARAGLLAFSGAFAECLQCIDEVERQLMLLRSDDVRWQLAMATSVRCFIACIHNDLVQAEQYAEQALRDLRDESRSFRATIYHALGDTYRRHGRWEDAKACYLTVPRVIDAPGFQVQAAVETVHVFGALADLEFQQGHLQSAATYWRKARAATQERESWGRVSLPDIGWVYVRTGELLYEWNEPADAWDHLSRGLQRAELSGDIRTMIAANLLAGRILLTDGDIEAAAEHLEQARPLVVDAPLPEWTSRFERLQLELWLAQDRLRAAVDWSDAMLSDDTFLQRPEPEVAQLATARVLIVKGDAPSLERALAFLAPLIQAASIEGRMGLRIEALALQSLADWRRGERTSAMTSLEHALRLAEPEGYLRLFADLGLPMVRLLQEARSREIMPDYVTALLAACGTPARPETALPEPLTDREQEILELIAAGLTNVEIANRLIISSETVKKHAGNIYGKLGVRGRTGAVARAREMALLH